MSIQLEKVVPFGRSMDEYLRMFAFSADDCGKAVIGVGDGPASFNAEMTALGRSVVSVDPIYSFGGAEIEKQFYAVLENMIPQVLATPQNWVWSYHKSPEQLKENRTRVMKAFISDYDKGKSEGRYLVGELPALKFEDRRFDLAVCSHFLFLYSEHLTYEFHRAAVLEMLRIAPEVRIFPLLTLKVTISPYVQPLIDELKRLGFEARIEKVDYELQRGGNEMLRIRKSLQAAA